MVVKRRNLVNPARRTATRARYISGIHAIAAWLRWRPRRLQTVHYDPRSRDRLAEIVRLAEAAGVPLAAASDEFLGRLTGTGRHQGVAAAAAPFPYAELADVLRARPRMLVMADQMQDPHNLGALLRTAEAAGAGAVLLPKDGSVTVTPSVEVAAAGAAALIPVCRVTNVARTLQALTDGGYWSVGLTPRGGVDLYRFDPPERVVVVVGGETGLRPLVSKHCDFAVSIPMPGRVESLNASVAAAIVIFELLRRWTSCAIVSGAASV